jgi:nucleotide-binding universal stress UspA family protein
MRPIRHILCPVDFTPVSNRELKLAVELAARFHAGLVLQHNLASGSALGVSWMHEQEHHGGEAAREADARKKLTALLDGLPRSIRERARGALTYGSLHHCVENLAAQADVDLIVIGTHGRAGVEHPSETERLIGAARCPVLTTRDDAPHEWLMPVQTPPTMIPTVVPIDFSAHSLTALRYALDLRHHLPLRLTVLYVPQRPEFGTAWAEAELAKTLSPADRELFKLDVWPGKPVDEILAEEAVLHARLVVMGAHVAGWIERLLFAHPSTSREVLHRSACPVWFVPATVEF